MEGSRPVRAPRGTKLTAQSWAAEAPMRMLMNNLDPEVAEHPDELVVYGGTGRAARDWRSFDAMVRTLEKLKADETMLVQSGRPVGVMQTHEWAPRVLIANSNLVPDWANWPEFRRLEQLGLTMYGQMTAGSWIYIGTQGIVQGTYETFAAVAEKRFGGTLAGTLTLTGGCGGMGGAQPLAVTMNDGACLIVDVDESRLRRRVDHRYLDEVADNLDDAIEKAVAAKNDRRAWSVGVVGNAAEIYPELLRRGVPIDIVTDQTSAHDPLSYLPEGISPEDWHDYADKKPEEFTDRARESMAKHVQAMVEFQDGGAEVFDYGNSIRDEARLGGYDRAFEFPGFVPAYIRPLFCEGKGPFRWAALSGDPKDIYATDKAVMDLFPDNDRLQKWMRGAKEKIAFQGLPARICWLGYGERDKAGLAINDLVASGEVSAPIVIGRDHLDCGSVASPYRETEAMADGSDAIADWPLLNALVNTSSGASWVSIHHGGGVGIGRSIHAGQVSLADGTPLAAQKLARVLSNDPGMGVIRHVDAGYERAEDVATDRGVRVPMRGELNPMAVGGGAQVEKRSIEVVPGNERHGSPINQFTLWFGANMQITAVVDGALAVVFGADALWAIIGLLIGNLLGGAVMALHSAQGPHLGLPQMISSRAQFGVLGAALPLVLVVVMYLGFAATGTVLSGQAINKILHVDAKPVGIIIFGVLTFVVAAFGYRWIHKLGRLATVLGFLGFAYLTFRVFHENSAHTLFGSPHFDGAPFLLAVALGAGWQLTFGPYVADYSRYLPRETTIASTFWATLGGSVIGSMWSMTLGVLIASIPKSTFLDNQVGFVGDLAGGGEIAFVIYIVIVVGKLTVNTLNAYGGSMTLLTTTTAFTRRATVRPMVRIAFVFGFLACSIVVALAGSANFLDNFKNFVLLLLTVFIPWSAINLVDYYLVSKERVDVPALYDENGRYGRYNVCGLTTYVIGVVVQIPFLSQSLYTGSIAKAIDGADVSWIVGLVVTAAVYYPWARATNRAPDQTILPPDLEELDKEFV